MSIKDILIYLGIMFLFVIIKLIFCYFGIGDIYDVSVILIGIIILFLNQIIDGLKGVHFKRMGFWGITYFIFLSPSIIICGDVYKIFFN